MATFNELSDDDDSFSGPDCDRTVQIDAMEDIVSISSDEEYEPAENTLQSNYKENSKKITLKNNAIKSLFPSYNKNENSNKERRSVVKTLFPRHSNITAPQAPPPVVAPKTVIKKPIQGINVLLPVEPYGSQLALMSKIITGIKKRENCILESPTGSGKTLALLCGALAWLQHEENQISQNQVQQYFTQHPEINKKGVAEYITSPMHQKTDVTPEKIFSKNNFGEKSIYQKPEYNGESSTASRQEKTPYREHAEATEASSENQVSIHKRRRVGSGAYEEENKITPQHTPQKPINVENEGTPEDVRKLYDLVNNLRVRTSMIVDCSLPTIYYGVRTHTQLEQVIKEFKRTSYCGWAKMTILSSRDRSCIKELNKDVWKSKDDMCRDCITSSKNQTTKKCHYYDNRTALNHNSLPPAFDIEDLVRTGLEKNACPYYGARDMAKKAHIIFCPYNYLIDPRIRSSLSIPLQGNILIIDEAHNIEGICRDVASLKITHTQIQTALKELEKVVEYRFTNQDVLSYIESLLKTLKSWDDWFENQKPLVNNQPVNFNEAVYKWDANIFVDTLNNHNIGDKNFAEFRRNSEILCRRFREDPRTLFGVTPSTCSLLESLDMTLGYLFRENCQFKDDYKPALVRNVKGRTESLSANTSWRASQYNQWVVGESLSLSLMCMNPGVVMQQLAAARCVALASGTLTPLLSLHSELATAFPHCVTPSHVIPKDRVWIGTLSGDSTNQLRYDRAGLDSHHARKMLGEVIIRVCTLTPHGVLCFLPSYSLLERLMDEWKRTDLWDNLNRLKNVFCESKDSRNHKDTMEEFYNTVGTDKGALLIAIYRGKVSEGMDFKDHQARAVICVGVPYPNLYDTAVDAKMKYNDKYVKEKQLLPGKEWLRVQAYRALNQAVGRCVRHRGDWGAVLLVDARYRNHYYTEHLSKWVLNFLGNNHHTYESLVDSSNGLAAFMHEMKIRDEQDDTQNT